MMNPLLYLLHCHTAVVGVNVDHSMIYNSRWLETIGYALLLFFTWFDCDVTMLYPSS